MTGNQADKIGESFKRLWSHRESGARRAELDEKTRLEALIAEARRA